MTNEVKALMLCEVMLAILIDETDKHAELDNEMLLRLAAVLTEGGAWMDDAACDTLTFSDMVVGVEQLQNEIRRNAVE